MTLWDLLLGICFCVGVVSASLTAKDLGGGFSGYALALVTGSAIGFCSVWMLSRLAAIVEAQVSKASSKVRKEWSAGTLYLFAIFWVVLVGVLTQRATSGLIQTIIRGR